MGGVARAVLLCGARTSSREGGAPAGRFLTAFGSGYRIPGYFVASIRVDYTVVVGPAGPRTACDVGGTGAFSRTPARYGCSGWICNHRKHTSVGA